MRFVATLSLIMVGSHALAEFRAPRAGTPPWSGHPRRGLWIVERHLARLRRAVTAAQSAAIGGRFSLGRRTRAARSFRISSLWHDPDRAGSSVVAAMEGRPSSGDRACRRRDPAG